VSSQGRLNNFFCVVFMTKVSSGPTAEFNIKHVTISHYYTSMVDLELLASGPIAAARLPV
jgi:hypothetical protein